MDKVYQEFARWVLRDLAVRVTPPKKVRVTPPKELPVVFKGNHMEHVYRAGSRAPRKSDFSFRLALAVESYIRAGESKGDAVNLAGEDLKLAGKQSPPIAVKLRAIGVPYPLPKFPLGKTKRSNRKKPKRTGWDPNSRRLETLRAQVFRYRLEHPEFQSLFEMWFGAYVAEFHRTPEWLEGAETVYRERLARAEEDLAVDDPGLAMATLELGRLLVERGKFGEAAPYLRLAQERWEALGATTEAGDLRREKALEMARAGIEACKATNY